MSFQSVLQAWLRCAIGLLLVAALVGCGPGEIKSYSVPKDSPRAESVSAPAAMPAGHPSVAPESDALPKPKLSWTLPPGWEHLGERPMSMASFRINAKNGKVGQVAVTPLPNMSSREDLIVNMWRQQASLPELSLEEVKQQLKPVTVGDEQGKMFEVSRPAEGTNTALSIVTAMVHRRDASWFYKLQGDPDVVQSEKPAFLEFLKSIKITEPSAEEVKPGSSTAAQSGTSSSGAVPAEWKAVAPGPMQSAKFAVPEKDGAKADVTVSVFPSAAGDMLANVNRWRGQIGLPNITEVELKKFITPLDDKVPESVLVDMINGKRQLVGAIMPRGGQWYYYKLLGDAEAVASQKEAFVKFARSGS